MHPEEVTTEQALLEAGPSSGSRQPTNVQPGLSHVVVDNPSDLISAAYTLSSSVAKPRPLNLADAYEIVKGVPAFVWGCPQDHDPNYRVYAISHNGSHIAILEGMHKICVYNMLENFLLVAEWNGQQYEEVDNMVFHNNQNNELVVVFEDSTVKLIYIATESEDPTQESTSYQQYISRMEIKKTFRILDNFGVYYKLYFSISSEEYETWVVAWNVYVTNTITLLSITQEEPRYIQIKANDDIIPTFAYCSISQKALLLVYMDEDSKPLRTKNYQDIDFTKDIIENSPRIFQDGQSFGFGNCGRYFLIWRYDEGKENDVEMYKIESLDRSLYLIGRKSLGHGVLAFQGHFVENINAAVKVLKTNIQATPPIVAFLVAQVNQTKLTFWTPTTNATLKELNLTIREMTFSNPIHIEFTISSNMKWVAIGCGFDGIFGLFSVLSGMQVWSIKLNTSITPLHTIIPLKFDNSNTRLIINACNTLYVICPPCLVEDYCLEFQSATYDIVKDFREQTSPLKLGHHLLIPKHMLMQMFFLKHELERCDAKEVLDIARSNITPSMALLICKDDALTVLFGSYEVFFESSFQKYIESKWSQASLPSSISELKIENLPVKQSQFSDGYQIAWIFLHLNEERNRDLVVVFLSQDSLQGVFINSVDMQNQERVSFSAQACFAIKQNKDGSKVSSLYVSGVMVIDLNQRVVLKDIRYQVNLSQLLRPYTTNRFEDCIDVTSDGRTILIGWDSKKMKLLTLTPQMVEEECKAMFVGKSNMVPTCMFGEDLNKAIFLKSLNDDQKVPSICIYSTKGRSLKSITDKEWNPQTKRVINIIIQENFLNYALCYDKGNGQLWIIVIQKTNAFSQLMFLPINPWSEEKCIPLLHMRDYPTREINELDELISQFGLSFFNMTFGGKTNFRIAFENKDKALMNKLLSYSNQVDLSLNDVLVGSFEEDFSHNFLNLAIKNKNEAGVAFFFDLLEKRSLPFEQGASMLKEEFSNLWVHYRSMLEPKIMSDSFKRQLCDIEVPIEVVSGSNEAGMGTINSIEDWEHAANRGSVNAYYRSLHGDALVKIEKKCSNATITALVWYFAQAFKKTGPFVLMIENIIKDCAPFLVLALVILLGFSFAMFVLFQQALHENDHNDTRDLIKQSFGNPWKTMVTMFYAMVGTFEPEVYHDSGSLSILITIMFILYLAAQMIVMVNMLIAIMADTFDRVKSTEEEQLLMGRARFIDACEAQLNQKDIGAIELSIGNYLYVLLPKDKNFDKGIQPWHGRVKTIEDKVEEMIKTSQKEIMEKMDEKLEETKEDIREIKQLLRSLIGRGKGETLGQRSSYFDDSSES
eukprot:g7453.t1